MIVTRRRGWAHRTKSLSLFRVNPPQQEACGLSPGQAFACRRSGRVYFRFRPLWMRSPSSSAQWQLLVVATAAAACTLTTAALYLAINGFPVKQQHHQHRQHHRRNKSSASSSPSEASSVEPIDQFNKDQDTSTMGEKVKYLNNADACYDYVVGKDDADEFEDVKVVAKEICAGWAAASDDQISVKIVSGGITNRLYRLSWQNESVLVRLYGDNTEAFIDRKVENMLFAILSQQGFAPTYYGRFTNGRIEGWMDARPLEPEEMGLTTPVDFLSLVGKELGLMHQFEVPLDKSKPVLWAKIDQFEHLASEIKMSDPVKLTQLLELDLPTVRADLQWLKSVLPSQLNGDGRELLASLDDADEITKQAFTFAHEVVFCHNDALSGNILYNDTWDRVQIIDYEYGGYNFRGFDFANHFCEHCGFEMDLGLYPDPEQQFVFFRAYMQVKAPELLASLEANKESKAFFHALYPFVNRYALASHLFWGFWAVVQAAHSKIDFDFLDYAQKRFNTFRFHRSFFFPPQ